MSGSSWEESRERRVARCPQQLRLSGRESAGSSSGAGRALAALDARAPSRATGSGGLATLEVRCFATLG